MPLYEIDDAATQRRLETVTAEGVRALDECGERTDQIDRAAREAFAREEAERQAMAEEIEKGRNPEPAPGEPAPIAPWQVRPPKSTVLSLGGEELVTPPPAAVPAPVPEPPTVQPAPAPAPVRRPPAPAEDEDDDLSGRRWMS